MAKITLCTGGVRSGKSSYALALAKRNKGKKVFIATATALDDEMKLRIKNHRKSRGKMFRTMEEPYELAATLSAIDKTASVIVIDCLTVWLGNIFYKYDNNERNILRCVELFVKELKRLSADCIIVTNETGWGIVPENKMARSFRDIAGYMNQGVAAIADRVYLFVCGIPVKIKGE
jgi:adenosylcobinamide kinase / adenosylcobinamide-phosphate guanylyltransferase